MVFFITDVRCKTIVKWSDLIHLFYVTTTIKTLKLKRLLTRLKNWTNVLAWVTSTDVSLLAFGWTGLPSSTLVILQRFVSSEAFKFYEMTRKLVRKFGQKIVENSIRRSILKTFLLHWEKPMLRSALPTWNRKAPLYFAKNQGSSWKTETSIVTVYYSSVSPHNHPYRVAPVRACSLFEGWIQWWPEIRELKIREFSLIWHKKAEMANKGVSNVPLFST